MCSYYKFRLCALRLCNSASTYLSWSETLHLNTRTKNLGVNLRIAEQAVLPLGFPTDTDQPRAKLGNKVEGLQLVRQSTNTGQQPETQTLGIWTPPKTTTSYPEVLTRDLPTDTPVRESFPILPLHHWHTSKFSNSVLQPHTCQVLTASKWSVLWGKWGGKNKPTKGY